MPYENLKDHTWDDFLIMFYDYKIEVALMHLEYEMPKRKRHPCVACGRPATIKDNKLSCSNVECIFGEWKRPLSVLECVLIVEVGVVSCLHHQSITPKIMDVDRRALGKFSKRMEVAGLEKRKIRRTNDNKTRTVKQYTLDRNLIKTFNNLNEAAKETGVSKSAISRCCRGTQEYAGDFYWRYGGSGERTVSRVAQYEPTGKLVKVWGSVSEIEDRLGYARTSITRVCSGKRKRAYEFIWRWVDE